MKIHNAIVLPIFFLQCMVSFCSEESKSKEPLFFEIETMNQLADAPRKTFLGVDIYLKEEKEGYVVLLNDKFSSTKSYLPLLLPSAYRLCRGIEDSELSDNRYGYIQCFVKTEKWKQRRLNTAIKCLLDVRLEDNKEKAKKFCDWVRSLCAEVGNGALFDAVVRSNRVDNGSFQGCLRDSYKQEIDLNKPLFYKSLEFVDGEIVESIQFFCDQMRLKLAEKIKEEKDIETQNQIFKENQNRKRNILTYLVLFIVGIGCFWLGWLMVEPA